MKKTGTVFDFKESEGDWFEYFESSFDMKTGEIIYDDPKPGTGRACFRSTMPFVKEHEDKREIVKSHVFNPKTRAMDYEEHPKSRTPEEKQQYNDDMYDYAIVGLENFFDAEGNALECTRENKLKLAKVPVFDRFMARCMELQLNAKSKQAEVTEKNSKIP